MSFDLAAPSSRGLLKLTLATALAFVILCGLGTWQIQRLRWKLDLLARVAALQHAPARPLAAAMAAQRAGQDVGYMRVEADCPGLAHAPYVRLYALNDGRIGDRLISACPLPGGGAILVDRGFLLQGAAPPAVDAASQAPLHVTGVLRKPDPRSLFTPAHHRGGRWFSRDLAGMARELSAPAPAPYFLSLETRTNPEDPALLPAPVPTNIPNNHLGYVITWFGLAAALAGVYLAMLRQRLRGRPR